MTLDNNFVKKFEGNFSQDKKLSHYSWFNLGGNAEYFYKAKDKGDWCPTRRRDEWSYIF